MSMNRSRPARSPWAGTHSVTATGVSLSLTTTSFRLIWGIRPPGAAFTVTVIFTGTTAAFSWPSNRTVPVNTAASIRSDESLKSNLIIVNLLDTRANEVTPEWPRFTSEFFEECGRPSQVIPEKLRLSRTIGSESGSLRGRRRALTGAAWFPSHGAIHSNQQGSSRLCDWSEVTLENDCVQSSDIAGTLPVPYLSCLPLPAVPVSVESSPSQLALECLHPG